MTLRELHTPAGIYTTIEDEYGAMSLLGDIAEQRRALIRRAERLLRDAKRIEEAMAQQHYPNA